MIMELTKYKLGEVLENYDYLRKPLSSMERSVFQGVYPYYGAQGIIDHVREYRCDGEYLLVAEDGENLSSRKEPIAQIAKGKFWVNNHAHIVKTNSKADLKYILYLLNTSDISGYVTDAAQPKLSQTNLNKITFELPPLPTQRKITSILSSYDSLIENNVKRIRLLEQMAENLYKEWFVRFRFPGHENTEFVDGLPKGWKYENLFDVANVSYGYAFKSNLFCDDKTLNAVVRIRDIQDNHTDTYTNERCDDKYLIEENAIIIGMDGIFHMCLWNGERAYLNQRVVKILSKNTDFCNYMLLMAIRPQVKFWEQVIVGTTVAHLGDKHLRKMKVLVPERAILVKANKQIEMIMKEKNKLFRENSSLIRQRDLLLPRLMSGKLEVKS